MKYFLTLVLALILGLTTSKSQVNINNNPYWDGEILMKDGSVKSGLIRVPSESAQNAVAFKTNENAENQRIDLDEIKYMQVTSPNGKPYIFERTTLSLG